jgi:menaquinone-dependent protoporphyrinogen IX oxidase
MEIIRGSYFLKKKPYTLFKCSIYMGPEENVRSKKRKLQRALQKENWRPYSVRILYCN